MKPFTIAPRCVCRVSLSSGAAQFWSGRAWASNLFQAALYTVDEAAAVAEQLAPQTEPGWKPPIVARVHNDGCSRESL